MAPKVLPKVISPTKPHDNFNLHSKRKRINISMDWKGGKEDGWSGKQDG
jgi:hypothetical protein